MGPRRPGTRRGLEPPLRRPRPDDRGSRSAEAVRPVRDVRRRDLRVDDDVRKTDGRSQPREQIGHAGDRTSGERLPGSVSTRAAASFRRTIKPCCGSVEVAQGEDVALAQAGLEVRAGAVDVRAHSEVAVAGLVDVPDADRVPVLKTSLARTLTIRRAARGWRSGRRKRLSSRIGIPAWRGRGRYSATIGATGGRVCPGLVCGSCRFVTPPRCPEITAIGYVQTQKHLSPAPLHLVRRPLMGAGCASPRTVLGVLRSVPSPWRRVRPQESPRAEAQPGADDRREHACLRRAGGDAAVSGVRLQRARCEPAATPRQAWGDQ